MKSIRKSVSCLPINIPSPSNLDELSSSRNAPPHQAGKLWLNNYRDDASSVVNFIRSPSPISDDASHATISVTPSLGSDPSHQETSQEVWTRTPPDEQAQLREKRINTINDGTNGSNGIPSHLERILTPPPLDTGPEQPTPNSVRSSATLPAASSSAPPPDVDSSPSALPGTVFSAPVRPNLRHRDPDNFGSLYPWSRDGYIRLPLALPRIRQPIRHEVYRPHAPFWLLDCSLCLSGQWREVCHDCHDRICDECKRQCPGTMLHRVCQDQLGNPNCYRALLCHEWNDCPLH